MTPAIAKLREWRACPPRFVRDVFRCEPDAWQDVVLEAFGDTANQRMALKACKGPGKTTVESWCGWNFLATRLHPKVAATSITADNLRDNLWTEFSKWQGKSPYLKNTFQWTASRITHVDYPETWWASARNWPKDADQNAQADTLAGLHADYLLFLIDESGGIPDAVFAAAEAALATGIETRLFQSGNPTQTQGPLHRACTRERHLWWVYEITGDPDSPERAPRISKEWARQQIAKYGADNPWVLVNVFGRFPPGQSNTLIGADSASAAMRRDVPPAEYMEEAKILGVDVARFGDDTTVLMPRQGRVCFRPTVFRNIDTMQTAGQVALAIGKWQPDAVFVDVTGVGAGVVDRLHELGHSVIGVEFGGKPIRSEPRTLNLRAEMWWQMADWLRSGGAIPEDGELVAELTGPTYKFDSSGRLVLESKDEMKKRGLPSPNKGDSLALTFAQPVARRPAWASMPGSKWDVNQCVTQYDRFAETRAGDN